MSAKVCFYTFAVGARFYAESVAELRVEEWQGAAQLTSVRDYRCGYCGREANASLGYEYGTARDPVIALCPHCASPTLLEGEQRQIPGELVGRFVAYLPADIELLFLEARLAVSAGAYTGSVLMCRKVLAHIAVAQGAETGRDFLYVLDYLETYLPVNLRSWLEYLRARSREAHHEISIMNRKDALATIGLVEALLRFIYELPNQVPTLPDLDDLLR